MDTKLTFDLEECLLKTNTNEKLLRKIYSHHFIGIFICVILI